MMKNFIVTLINNNSTPASSLKIILLLLFPKSFNLKIELFLFFIFFVNFTLHSQPGAIDLSFDSGTNNQYQINSILPLPDGKIIASGSFQLYNNRQVYNIARLNSNGSLDTTFYNQNTFTSGKSLLQSDGKIVIGVGTSSLTRLNSSGTIDGTYNFNVGGLGCNFYVNSMQLLNDGRIVVNLTQNCGTTYHFTFIINSDGTRDFSVSHLASNIVREIEVQNDGKIIIGGDFNATAPYSNLKNRIARLNSDLTIDTSFNIGTGFTGSSDQVHAIEIQDDNKIIVAGNFTSYNSYSCRNIVRLNPNGTVDSSFYIGTGSNNIIYDVLLQDNGKIVLTGVFTDYQGYARSAIVRINDDGHIDTTFNIGTGTSFNQGIGAGLTLALQEDGKILLGGNFTSYNNYPRSLIARIHGDNSIFGKVYNDLNRNCLYDNAEIGLSNRRLIIQPGNIIVETNQSGQWYLDSLSPGTYNITIDTSNNNWSTSCPVTQTFTVIHQDSITICPDFGLFTTNPCTSPDVSIVMPTMRRGFSNQIYVSACNQFTATGILDSAYTIIKLPTQITLQGASLPFTSLGNNKYRFYLGNIIPGQCINFTINATVNVSLQAQNGRTLCLSAELFPQAACVFDSIPTPYITLPNANISPCTTAWDNSSLEVEGYCVGDSVRFVIYNRGEPIQGDMSCFAPVRFYLDGQWVRFDSVQIAGTDSVVFMVPGTGGTWRLEADQHPLHPGNSRPNASVENCGNGTWTPGIINTMPQNDADPVIDIYCGQVTAPLDPNDKTGFPLGIGTNHNIRQNQQIEYLIRFQNVGTDTAVNVVIRDTLTTDLNIFTVQSGVASHPYEFRMYGPRILEWKFNNIMLPDSNTNSSGSNGFVKFTVEQNPDLPFGTVIENKAAIYFDFEAPVITNTYFHTIHDFTISVISSNNEIGFEDILVKVIPNPFRNNAILQLEGLENIENLELEIFNISGQRVQYLNNSQNGQFQLSRGEMSQGIYFFSVKQGNKVVSRGKMVVE